METAVTLVEIEMLKLAEAELEPRPNLLAPFTCTVNEAFPAVDGMPLIAPVDELSKSPAGSDPLATDHVYGFSPPDAERAAA